MALDAACGTGRHSAKLAGLGHEVIGVDSSAEMLALAARKVPDGRFLLGDLTDLPVPAASVDLVVCGLALTHQPSLLPVFREFARVLRPGGRVVTSDIHGQTIPLGGVAQARSDDGVVRFMPASRFLASDYLAAALGAGLQVEVCHEPRWGVVEGEGGPLAQYYCPDAAAAAYRDAPAAIIWQFRYLP